MKHLVCTALAVATLMGLAILSPTAVAEEAEPDWVKTEEPALRPYKAVGRGFAAFWYQTVQALARGNEKLPIFGSVEVFRGMRHGIVEFTEHTTTGMAFSGARDWKQTGAANTVINEDVFLRNAADIATSAAIARVGGANTEDTAAFATIIWAGQKKTDRSPFDPNKDEQVQARIQRAQERYAAESSRGALHVNEHAIVHAEDSQWKKAQRSYVGDRADINARSGIGGGNLLKLAR